MKNLFKSLFLTLAIAGGTLFTSCDNDSGNDVLRQDPNTGKDPNTTKSYAIKVTPENGSTKEREVTIVAEPGKMVEVTTSFTGSKNMYRLYLTKNVYSEGKGAVPYEYELGVKKKDGSIDLQRGDKKEFTFAFNFDAPAKNNDIVEYQLWVTNGRGDFRDVSKRNAIDATALGKVIIKSDENANVKPVTIKEFTAVLLAAPLEDGSSKSFISMFNNTVYSIDQGEEFAALWDLGYYYGKTGKSSLASVKNYPKSVIDVPKISNVAEANLNEFFIGKSTKTVADFDKIKEGTELNNIVKPTTQSVNGLAKGDVLEFVDAYGNIGLIKVTEVVEGFGTSGKIVFDVKIQVKAEPIKG